MTLDCLKSTTSSENAIKSLAGVIIYNLLAMGNAGFSAKNNENSVLSIVDSPFDMESAYDMLVEPNKCSSFSCVDTLPDNLCIDFKDGTNHFDVLNKCPVEG